MRRVMTILLQEKNFGPDVIYNFCDYISCKSKPACTFLKNISISARFNCRFRIYAKFRVVYARSQLRRCDMRRVMAKTSYE